MFRNCVGKLGWSPDEFWSASLPEVWLALEGFAEFHAVPAKDDPPTQDELDELLAAHPDAPPER